MFRNYCKLALRNISRYKGFSFLNIAGLSVGIACCLLIFLWISDESSYDNFHRDSDRIYRVALEIKTSTNSRLFAQTSLPLGPALKDNFPQVESFVRFMRWREWLVKNGEDKMFYEENYYFTDPSVFEVFNVQLIKGNPQTALSSPATVVLSEDMAWKYFGDQEPLGKTLNINTPFGVGDFEVTGVMANLPHNTHLKFDFLSSIELVKDNSGVNTWPTTMFYTYIKTAKNSDIKQLGAQVKGIAEKYIGKMLADRGVAYNFFLQPLEDIHLYSNLRYETEDPGNPLYIYIFAAVAIFILLIACINFINLTTAHSSVRAMEVGIRKVVGAHKIQLVKQFLAESAFLCAVAFVVAMLLVKIALPFFNTLTGKPLEFNFFTNFYMFLGIIVTFVFVGVVSGSYPAFFLASLQPVLMTKRTFRRGTKTAALRKILVIFQFAVSVTLIVGVIIVAQQLKFVKNHSLGFDKEQVIVLPVRSMRGFSNNYESVKSEFLRIPSVASATASDGVPGREFANFSIKRLDMEETNVQNMYHLDVDYDFIDVYNIKMAAGRKFLRDSIVDAESAFLVNEAAVKALGWNTPKEAVGKRIESGQENKKGEIVGVFTDFNYRSLYTGVEPLIMTILPRRFTYLSFKLKEGSEAAILDDFKSKWGALFPGRPFEYFFLDQDFELQYQGSDRLGKIFGMFTFLAIIIACLGLLGLVSFMTIRRSREIGIRKVVGASSSSIVLLISREFTKLVGIANCIALPLAYFIMAKWLNAFAYRIHPSLWIFIAAGILSFLIAFLTMSYQAIKASGLNPVDVLKSE